MLRATPLTLFAALALGAGACPPPAPNPPSGAGPAASGAPAAAGWKPKGFTRAAEGCAQAWSCDCGGTAAKSGCHLEGARDESTTGVCAADSGPPTGCTRCMALPPAAACACKDVCP